MRSSAGLRGLSLLETLISLFVLISAFVIVLSLFIKSSEYQVNVDRKIMAAAFAETVLDDLKAWASDYNNYSGDWSSWSSKTLAEYPGYTAAITVVTPEVPDPCTNLEAGKVAAERVLMRQTFRDVTLRVSFEGARQLSLSTRLTEPARAIGKVEVTLESGSSSLAPHEEATYQARLLDSDNKEVEDITFAWTIQPLGGNATAIAAQPDSSRATLRHSFVGADGVERIISGSCQVVATARYRGVEYQGVSSAAVLQP